MSTIDLVKIAFRKLKSSVYFDKTVLPLRDEVVKFEARHDFDAKLQELADVYDNKSPDKNKAIMAEIIESIVALPFPKGTKPLDNKNNVISVGNPEERATVSKLQYFIDMDVRGHIIGILWIIKFGKRLDKECYKYSFGNRLRQSFIWDEDSGEVKYSPALFEPYFGQYSHWRNDALSSTEEALKNGHDALILTLDLKQFYYSVGITKELFDELLQKDEKINNENIHSAIFSIIQKYTQVLSNMSVECNGNVLPIGFLPSAVLSNWCLSKFDNGILNYWNPHYYGRYVDDIIIVEKFDKNSEIYQNARNNSLTIDYVIRYFLCGKRNNEPFLSIKKADECTTYEVNTTYCLSEKSKLVFQSDKIRVFTFFSDNNSTALINKFKKQIYENVSEFRLMPEVGEAFLQDDFSQFYHLENDATINKLCGIRNITMDKFELSKFLGKYRVISSLVDDDNAKKFTVIIGKMFNERELIDNYVLWERVLEIFATDNDYLGFSKFVERIAIAIDKLKLELKCKDSLRRHLTSSVSRVLSLLYGENVTSKILDKLPFKLNSIIVNDLRKKYLETLMSNKYVMAVPAEAIKESPPDKESVNFTDFKSTWEYLQNKKMKNKDTSEVFPPYFQQAQDIAIARVLKNPCEKHQDVCAYIKEIKTKNKIEPYEKSINIFDVNKKNDRCGISVNRHATDKLKIAVANVNVSKVYNLESLLSGRNPNRTYSRYKDLADIVNAAIKENTDMLVLPENYIPFEWLAPLAAKAAREDLAIVTGVEHIITKGKGRRKGSVYNYTAVILPFKYFNSIPTAAVFFQLKKHYSPEEKCQINGYGYNTTETNLKKSLYYWKGCYFPVYCCYELTVINDRAEFISLADMVIAVEFNKDTNYFSSIVESLTRDLHCYCVQVNTSEYGDSRIVQPTRSVEKNILSVKGGLNQTLLVGEINISELREFQLKEYTLQKNGKFKPTPPGINVEIVRSKIARSKNL
jgi:hypothetical protein